MDATRQHTNLIFFCVWLLQYKSENKSQCISKFRTSDLIDFKAKFRTSDLVNLHSIGARFLNGVFQINLSARWIQNIEHVKSSQCTKWSNEKCAMRLMWIQIQKLVMFSRWFVAEKNVNKTQQLFNTMYLYC